MKDIRPKLLDTLKAGGCTPLVSALARTLGEPATTIHYNIKKLEREGTVLAYRAVLDHRQAGAGFCTYALLSLSPDEYGHPERVARELARHPQVESVDICTGDWEIVTKIRVADIDAYYAFVTTVLNRKGIVKISSLNSMRQVKSEFVTVPERARKSGTDGTTPVRASARRH
jgi:DNA-binding Lrp family transcriptional regulator